MKIKTKFKQFKSTYKLLVEYFTHRPYEIPDFLYKDLVQLVVILDQLGINVNTYLIANFRMFERFDTFKYPYIRYLLNNTRSFRLYEEHHRVHGDYTNLRDYSRIFKLVADMKQASNVWFGMKAFTTEEKIDIYVRRSPDVFKHYIQFKYKTSPFQYDHYKTLQAIVDVIPFSTLEKLFKLAKRYSN